MKLVYKNQLQLMELFNRFSTDGEMTTPQFEQLCEVRLCSLFASAVPICGVDLVVWAPARLIDRRPS